jgi:hypothetical protein
LWKLGGGIEELLNIWGRFYRNLRCLRADTVK